MIGTRFSTLHIEYLDNGILHAQLARADKLNALNYAMFQDLDALFEAVAQENCIKALLISGQGRAFCAGADISELAAWDAAKGEHFSTFGQSVFRKLETLGKPSLAAIHGTAAGGGCELALAANLRFATPDARFALPEVKLGLIPGYGGTQRLARLVGKGRAMALCLSGDFIDATEALNWGLVNTVTATLIPDALAFLNKIIRNAPLALSRVINAIDRGLDLPLADGLQLESLHFAQCCATQDKQTGVEAFLNKKAAEFVGK